MNNKGFELIELIIFIVVSLIVLVICTIVYNQNFGKIDIPETDEPTQIVEDSSNTENVIEDDEQEEQTNQLNTEYDELLQKMISSSKIYISDNYTGTTDQIIIKLSKLIDENYITELTDPKDDDTTCKGYVIYDGTSSYDAYLKCGTNYVSENYNEDYD